MKYGDDSLLMIQLYRIPIFYEEKVSKRTRPTSTPSHCQEDQKLSIKP